MVSGVLKRDSIAPTRHAGHWWRSRDELIRDVLLWTSTHGRAKAGRPARTYIQQLCEDTGCCPEDLPRAMNDREEWRERVRVIRATSAIWWWWWLRTLIDLIKENAFTLIKSKSGRYPTETVTDADYTDNLALLANTTTQAESRSYHLEQTARGIDFNVKSNKT